MRQIALDTETTGLEVQRGHRVIEIGAVLIEERRVTRHTFHTYLNPDRAIDEGARQVTGIEDEFLLDKPRFSEVVEDFLTFIEGAQLIIHNAAFDVGFLDAELKRASSSHGCVNDHASVLDTLDMARKRYPGQRNSLDALCRRLGVDNTHRDMHGGLLDAQLLAEVYLAMTSGQVALELGFSADQARVDHAFDERPLQHRPRVLLANDAEQAAHIARLDALDESAEAGSVWRHLDANTGA